MFNHRHAKIVAFIHLIVSLFERHALTCTLLCKVFGIRCTATLFVISTHIHYLYTVKIQLQALCKPIKTVGIAKQNRRTDAFLMGLNGSLHHGGVPTFCKNNTLWMQCSCGV